MQSFGIIIAGNTRKDEKKKGRCKATAASELSHQSVHYSFSCYDSRVSCFITTVTTQWQ